MVQKAQDDELYANNSRTLEFTITDEDNSDAPLDITGFTVQWALSRVSKSGKFSTTPIFKKTTVGGAGVTITDAAGGVVEVEIDPADTAALSGLFYQELEVIDGVGDPVVVATGNVTIIRNVSNA